MVVSRTLNATDAFIGFSPLSEFYSLFLIPQPSSFNSALHTSRAKKCPALFKRLLLRLRFTEIVNVLVYEPLALIRQKKLHPDE